MRRRPTARVIEALEGRRLPASLLGLLQNDVLVRFDSANPGQLQATLPISGVAAGETIAAVAFRPATGQLYGLGSNADLYPIDAATGKATAVGGRFATALSGSKFALTFDGSTDTARVLSDTGQEFVVDPDSSQVTIDANLFYLPTDPNFGHTPRVVAAAYTDVAAVGQAAPTLYAIDQSLGDLVRIGSPNGTPLPAGQGELTTIGRLGVDTTTLAGLDITTTPDGLAAYAAVNDPSHFTSTLRTLDLSTGASTLVGPIAAGSPLIDLAVVPRVETLYVLSGVNLVRIRADDPGSPIAQSAIQGLPSGTAIASIAYRPDDGRLYGLARAADGATSLYTIDTATGHATRLGPIGGAASFLAGKRDVLTYDPNSETFRVVDELGDDLRIDPINLVATADHSLIYAPGDPNAGRRPALDALAVTAADPAAIVGYDPAVGSLVRLANPADGVLRTVDISGPIVEGPHALATGNGVGFYAEPDPSLVGQTTLYRFDTATGQRIALGDFNGPIASLVVAPAGAIGFSTASATVDATTGTARISVLRTGGSSGAVTVRYTTVDTSAGPLDYTPVRGLLTFADGQTESGFVVPLHPASPGPATQVVTLALTDDYGGARPGLITSRTLSILTPAPVVAPTLVGISLGGTFRAATHLDLHYDLPLDSSKLTTQQIAVFGITGGRRPVTTRLGIASIGFDVSSSTVYLAFDRPISLTTFKTLRIVVPGEVSATGGVGRDLDLSLPILQGRVVRYRDSSGEGVTLSTKGRATLGVLIGPGGDALQVWVDGSGGSIRGQIARRRGGSATTGIGRLVLGPNRDELPASFLVARS